MCTADLGLGTFKLVTSNTRSWQPDREYLEGALLAVINHINSVHREEGMPYVLPGKPDPNL